MTDLAQFGYFTVEPSFGQAPSQSEGFVVHLADMQRFLPATAESDRIRGQILYNRAEAQRNAAYAEGGIDTDGNYVFDVFVIVNSCKDAIMLARANEQESIYDLESREELFLESPRERSKDEHTV